MDYVPNARAEAARLLEELRDRYMVNDTFIVEYLIYDWLSGSDALQALEDFRDKEI